MKNLTLIFILIPCIVFGQQKKKSPPPPAPPPPESKEQMAWDKKHDRCFNTSKYNPKQRRAFFPFNSAAKVKLISFSSDDIPYSAISVNNFSVDSTKVKEGKVLSAAGIDSLTDIMYNVGFTPMKHKRPRLKGELEVADPGYMCIFQPRHAILFIDSTGKVTQYISICFTCHQYYLSSRKIKYTVECENKYELLKSYFLSQGIKYGAKQEQ
ncbi:MAG: hypothetical protein JST50_15250 [Bacteroidetes bacterium]|jgi:hypothetical protein|nr:hypothetical protein [Bacteroidota bacterium]